MRVVELPFVVIVGISVNAAVAAAVPTVDVVGVGNGAAEVLRGTTAFGVTEFVTGIFVTCDIVVN